MNISQAIDWKNSFKELDELWKKDFFGKIKSCCSIYVFLIESVTNKKDFEHSGKDQFLALSLFWFFFVLGHIKKFALKELLNLQFYIQGVSPLRDKSKSRNKQICEI